MSSIERYASKLVGNIDCDGGVRTHLKAEFIDHLYSLRDEHEKRGLRKKDAIKAAISDFGKDSVKFNNKSWSVNVIIKVCAYILFTFFLLFICLLYISPISKEADAVSTIRASGSLELYLRTIILTPFKSMIHMYNNDSEFSPFFLNIGLFIPIGALLPFILKRYVNVKYNIKMLLLFTISIQLLRLIFPLGYVNIDLFILQFGGCIIGYFIYKFIIFNVLYKLKLLKKVS